MSTMKIEIRGAGKLAIFVEVNKNDTAQAVKLEIEKREEIASDTQRIFYRGKELFGNKPLKDYGVGHGTIIQLALRPTLITTKQRYIQSMHIFCSEYIHIISVYMHMIQSKYTGSIYRCNTNGSKEIRNHCQRKCNHW